MHNSAYVRNVWFGLVGLLLWNGLAFAQTQQRNRPEALKRVVEEWVRDSQKAQSFDVAGLILPDAEAWFKTAFGESPGTQLGSQYAARQSSLQANFAKLVTEASQKQKPQTTVLRVGAEISSDIELMQVAARPVTELGAYRVFLEHRDESQNVDLGYFVYHDGKFRYLGRIYIVSENSRKQILLVGPEAIVKHPLPKSRPRPRYPEAAKQLRTQGVVLMQATIRDDGNLEDMQVLQGNPLLAEPTVKTVAAWTYRPLEVDGKTYKAVTLIYTSFTLRQ